MLVLEYSKGRYTRIAVFAQDRNLSCSVYTIFKLADLFYYILTNVTGRTAPYENEKGQYIS